MFLDKVIDAFILVYWTEQNIRRGAIVPTELLSVTEAARDFLAKSGYSFVRLEKADLNDAKHEWVLTFDVGLAAPKLKQVRIDANTGKVTAFE